MKKVITSFRFAAFFVALLFSANSMGQTVLFHDNFNQTPVNPIVSSGSPLANYTIWTTVTPLTLGGGTALIEEYAANDGLIKLIARHTTTGQTGDRTEVSAPLSVYNVEFKPILNQNSDTIVWAFTARNNRNTTGGTQGFDGMQSGMAVVLASDGATWGTQQSSAAKGYAVTLLKPASGTYCVSLSRFDGGLSNYTVIAGNKPEDILSNLKTWFTVRVEYVPATNEWSLYFRDEGSTSVKGDISNKEGMRLIQKVVDDTFTNIGMTHFGFALNTPAPGATGANGNAFLVDDYKVMKNLIPITTNSVNPNCGAEFKVFPNSSNGKFTVQVTQPVSYKVYSINGVLIQEGNAPGSFELDLSAFNNPVSILQVESKDGVSVKRVVKLSK